MSKNRENRLADNQKLIVIIVLSVIVVIAIIAAIILGTKTKSDNDSKTPDSSPDSISVDENQVNSVNSSGENSSENVKAEIESLVTELRKAMMTGDVESAQKLYQVEKLENASSFISAAQIVTGYENRVCYIKDGLDDTSKVVFVYEELKFSEVDALVPNVSFFYIKTDETNNLYIYPGEYDPDSDSYVQPGEIINHANKMKSDQDIQELYQEVDRKFAALREENADLEAFIQKLLGNAADPDAGNAAGDGSDTPNESESDTDESESDSSNEPESDTNDESTDNQQQE